MTCGFLLAAALTLVPAAEGAERDLIVFRTDHRFSEQALRRDLLSLHTQLQSDLDVPPLKTSVQITILRDAPAYRDFLRTSVPGVRPTYRKGLFLLRNGRPYIFTYRQPLLNETIRHEFVHAVLNASHPHLPIWLDEGLAEFYRSADGSGERPLHRSMLRNRLRRGWRPHLKRLEQLTRMKQMGPLEYAEAWGWTHVLLTGPQQIRRIVPRYLSDLRTAPPPPADRDGNDRRGILFATFGRLRLPSDRRPATTRIGVRLERELEDPHRVWRAHFPSQVSQALPDESDC